MSEKLPEFLKPYFWDVDFEKLGSKKGAFFITKRVLDRGTTQALLWVVNQYGTGMIRQVVTSTRDLDRSTANFWADMLDLNKNKVPSLRRPYVSPHDRSWKNAWEANFGIGGENFRLFYKC